MSGFIGQAEGTIYAELDLRNFNTGASRRPFGISDGTTNNRIVFLITPSNTIRALVTEANAAQADIESLTSLSTGIVKVALAYAVNDFVLYVNGTQIGTDTSGAVPACSNVYIGVSESGTAQLNDRIRAAAIYPTRLTNSQLQSLTTL